MKPDRDLDEVLAAWLRPGPTDVPDRLFAAIVADVQRTGQHRRVPRFERIRTMSDTSRLVALAAAVLIALVAGSWLAGREKPALVGGPSSSPVLPAPSQTNVPASPSVAGAPSALILTAVNVAFDHADLYWPARTPLTIRLVSLEAVPHGLQLTDASGRVVFTGDNFMGPGERTYSIPALDPARYAFDDPIHPNMAGTLHIGDAAPTTTPTPSPTLPPADVVVTIGGSGFSPSRLMFAGGRRFSIELVNNDPGVVHGIQFLDAAGADMWSGPPGTAGPSVREYPIDALPTGAYTIVDPAHPEIRATLTIGG